MNKISATYKQSIGYMTYSLALELLGLTFLQAFKKPSWAATDLDVQPLGFNNRVSKKRIDVIGGHHN